MCVCAHACKMWVKLEKFIHSPVYMYTYIHTFMLISDLHIVFHKVVPHLLSFKIYTTTL